MIQITTDIQAPIKEVWDAWVSVEGVQHWAFASDDWAAEGIENDIKPGGKFSSKMYAKDGSAEFIFSGKYDTVEPQNHVTYTLDDGRKVEIAFEEIPDGVRIVQRFEAETENPKKMQQEGWQAYLDNFKRYVESSQAKNI